MSVLLHFLMHLLSSLDEQRICNVCLSSSFVENIFDKFHKILWCKGNSAEGFKASNQEKEHIKEDNNDVIIAIPDTDFSVHEVKNKGNKKKLLTCNICGSTFKEEEGLRNHFSEIHQWKKFNCDKCDACFNHYCDMKRHKTALHEGVKEFKCGKCRASFSTMDSMEKHMDSAHEGKKMFQCIHCGSSFSHKYSLKKHLLKFHNEMKLQFKCEVCSKHFIKEDNLKTHIETVHYKKKTVKSVDRKIKNPLKNEYSSIQCIICANRFANEACLKMHIASVHKKGN